MRRSLAIGLGVVGAVAALAVAGAVALPMVNLASMVVPRVSAALGRQVTLRDARLHLGWSLRVTLDDLHVANIPGASNPDMVSLRHASVAVAPASLLSGVPTVRKLVVDGLVVVLQRGPDRRGNWAFRPKDPDRPPHPDPTGRRGMPTLLDVHVHDSDIVYLLTGGRPLATHLQQADIASKGASQPVHLVASGAYNRLPVTLDLTGESFDRLRQAERPWGLHAVARSGTTQVTFDGTSTDPLNADGLDGKLAAEAPGLSDILASFGATLRADIAATLTAHFTHLGDDWVLTGMAGQVDTVSFGGNTSYTEGKRGQPDHFDAALAFDTLDVKRLAGLVGFKDSGNAGASNAMPPVPANPDAVGSAAITAKTIRYGGIEVTGVAAHAMVAPGKVTLDGANLTFAGAKATASALLEAVANGTHLAADAGVAGAELGRLAKALNIGMLPISGNADARLSVDMTGATIPAALKQSRVAAAVTMAGGTVPRMAIRLVSGNLGALFGGNGGTTTLRCLLAVADMRNIAGPVAPLRLATADGTIDGYGRLNLATGAVDATVRSERATTGFFALDVPIHIGGTLSDPKVLPTLSAEKRARLRAADQVGGLPPNVLSLVRASPCLRERS